MNFLFKFQPSIIIIHYINVKVQNNLYQTLIVFFEVGRDGQQFRNLSGGLPKPDMAPPKVREEVFNVRHRFALNGC